MIVPVTNGVQNALSKRLFLEGWYLVSKQAILKLLDIISGVNPIPNGVTPQKETFPIFGTI